MINLNKARQHCNAALRHNRVRTQIIKKKIIKIKTKQKTITTTVMRKRKRKHFFCCFLIMNKI